MNANVGMVYPVAATVNTYTPGTSITYNVGKVIDEGRGAALNWERSDGRFYGDDIELDTDNGIVGYTIDFEPTGLHDDVRAYLLGDTLANTEYTITDASAPDVGFGYVRVMRANGVSGVSYSYEAWWFYKLKFALNSEETRTKERSMQWRTPTLSGAGTGVLLDSSGKQAFAVHRTFTTKADAIAYIKAKAGIT